MKSIGSEERTCINTCVRRDQVKGDAGGLRRHGAAAAAGSLVFRGMCERDGL